MVELKKYHWLLSNKIKAMLITFFISATILMIIYNINLNRQEKIKTEHFYEMEPEEILSEEEIKELESSNNIDINTIAETNSAFNETEKSYKYSQTHKSIPEPEDYDQIQNYSNHSDQEFIEKTHEPTNKSKVNKEELTSFEKVNELLKKQKEKTNNNRSTISYALKNRTGNIPIPIYLCEESGIIVINIEVNSQGTVTKATLNKTESSTNQCLIENALEYARYAKFNPDASKPTQSGTITYSFIGKH